MEFLADDPFCTKRFAHCLGRRCHSTTTTELAKAGAPGHKANCIDEISIRKGDTYRIMVRDLLGQRPIWFGGEARS